MRLDRAVLAERPVEGDEDDRRRIGRGEPVDGARRPSPGRSPPSAAGSSQAAGGTARRGPAAGHPPPAAAEVDADPLDEPAGVRRARRRSPRPDTIDTSCSADGPPNRTATGGLAGRRAGAHPATSRSHSGPQSPRNTTSGSRVTPKRRPTSARTSSPRRRTSVAVPFRSLTRKLACLSLTVAPPTRVPLRPAASMSRPAESPGGFRKYDPALGSPSGWWAWRQRRISSRRSRISSGVAGTSRNVAVEHDLGRAARAAGA